MKIKGLMLGVIFGMYAGLVYTNPQNPQVVHGQVDFARPAPHILEITNTPNAIINWQQFNIDPGEITRFIQQHANSAVLNRVTGEDPSAIMGSLLSNGRVFVINPNGVIFGENATVNTAGLIASSLNLSDEDFISGHYRFHGDAQSGAIINHGLIAAGRGGEVVLIAPQIENHGVIRVQSGTLILAAGEKVTLTSLTLDGIQFEVQAPGNRVLNLGHLLANGGAAGLFAGSITHSGAIEANSIGRDAAGNIVLRAESDIEIGADAHVTANGVSGGDISIQSLSGDTLVRGTVTADGTASAFRVDPEDIRAYRYTDRYRSPFKQEGGEIEILGERVGLFGDAYVSASGLNGGGEVLVGGDYQGGGVTPTARQTQIGADAEIHVDALLCGDGGRAIVWADGYTDARSLVTARGGRLGGDGGFVEISGKESLVFRGEVDTRAPLGLAGQVLFDPQNITVSGSGNAFDPANDEFLENPGTSVTFTNSSISALLANQAVTLQANNDIQLDAFVSGSNDFTLEAGRSVLFNANGNAVTLSGGANLTVIANSENALLSNRLSGPGNIDMTLGQADIFSMSGGDMLFEIRNGAQAGSILLGIFENFNSGGGNITFRANSIDLSQADVINTGSGNLIIEPFTAGLPIQIGGVDPGTGFLHISVSDLNLGSVTTSINRLIIGNANTGDINVAQNIALNQLEITGALELQTAGNILFAQGDFLEGVRYSGGIVVLNAGGRIFSSNPNASTDIVASSLNAVANSGIDLEVDISSLNYNNNAEGAVQIINTGAASLDVLSGNNSSTGFFTRIETQGSASNLTINGTVNDNTTNGLSFVTGFGDITNNGAISARGGVDIDTSSGFFINSTNATIDNAGTAGADIVISANDVDLQSGSSIDAGALSKIVFKGLAFDLGSAAAGDGVVNLSQNELNTLSDTIAIGDTINTSSIIISNPLVLNGQDMILQSSGDLIVGNSINIGGGDLRLETAGSISQTAAIIADALSVSAVNGIDLRDSGNNVNGFTANLDNASTQGISFSETNGFEVQGISYTGLGGVDLFSGGAITQAAGAGNALNVSNLFVTVANDGNAGIRLDNATNAISGFVTLQAVEILGDPPAPSAGDLNLNNTLSTQISSLQTTSNIVLTSGGQVTQSGAVLSNALNITANNGIVLRNLGNSFNTLTAINNNAGQVDIINNNGGNLSIVPAGVQNRSTNINDGVAVQQRGGSLIVDGLVQADGGSVTLNATAVPGSDIIVNTDIFAATNVNLNTQRDLIVSGDGIGGPGTRIEARNGNALVNVGRDLIISGGADPDQSAGIEASANLDLNIGNDLIMSGGAGVNAKAYLEAANLRGLNTFGGDIILSGGSGAEAGALIRASITLDLSMAGDLLLSGGGGQEASAVIGNRMPDDNLAVTLDAGGDIVVDGGILQANQLMLDAGGVFILDDGLLQTTAGGTVNSAFIMNGGEHRVAGVLNFLNGYTQNGGRTDLQSGELNITGDYDLMAGVLSGNGVVTTANLNNVGGKIAPGSDLESPVVIGTLDINGNLIMGSNASISLDLAGSDTAGGRAGVDYDLLQVSGTASLAGDLALIVDTEHYLGSINHSFNPLRFENVTGEFANVIGLPTGYQFAVMPGINGLEIITLSVPGRNDNRLIPDDELEALRQDLEGTLNNLHRRDEREDEDERRKVMMCSR